jgi:undecaprenyl-diphosphatase
MITQKFDLPILDWIAVNLHNPLGDALMPALTFLGDGGWIWIAMALILLCIPKYRKTGLTMGVALLMGLLICNLWLKPWIGRLRPFDYQLQCYGRLIPLLIEAPADFSFPSGHTIASFEAATVLLIRHKKWGIPTVFLAVLIAFSRLYLYVHYPTDVLASIVLGVSIAFAANYLVNQGYTLYERKKLQ